MLPAAHTSAGILPKDLERVGTAASRPVVAAANAAVTKTTKKPALALDEPRNTPLRSTRAAGVKLPAHTLGSSN
jgi:hypothetical protein